MPTLGVMDADLNRWFTYHPPSNEQAAKYVTIRDAALHLARVVLALTPSGPDQTVAIRTIREAVMWANGAIACEPPA